MSGIYCRFLIAHKISAMPNNIQLSLLLVIASLFGALKISAQGDIKLLAPDKQGGMPVMQCFSQRQTQRDFTRQELSPADLSGLLWAAYGINREDKALHTAPTALNRKDIEVYMVNYTGLYLYLPESHSLKLLKEGDFMADTGLQSFVADASVNIIVVSDLSKMPATPEADRPIYAGIHAGAVMQNIYLYCASVGLNTVARRYFDYKKVSDLLELPDHKLAVIAQSVGKP
jgi:SagB-type dehydrogenase family enzyme